VRNVRYKDLEPGKSNRSRAPTGVAAPRPRRSSKRPSTAPPQPAWPLPAGAGRLL